MSKCKVYFSGTREFELNDYDITVEFRASGTAYYDPPSREDPGCDEVEVEDVEIISCTTDITLEKDVLDTITDAIRRACEDYEYEPEYE